MEESILKTVKQIVTGRQDSNFDIDLLTYINSIFAELTQLGIGPTGGFTVENEETTWSDYDNDDMIVNLLKSYLTIKVRLMFDPPSSSTLLEAYDSQVKRLEWRLYMVKNPDNLF